jgi:hypothetical protein
MNLKGSSSTEITEETGVSRSTQWRIRQNKTDVTPQKVMSRIGVGSLLSVIKMEVRL